MDFLVLTNMGNDKYHTRPDYSSVAQSVERVTVNH
jgi:hypothetical protein